MKKCVDGKVSGWVDGRRGGWVDGWMEKRKNENLGGKKSLNFGRRLEKACGVCGRLSVVVCGGTAQSWVDRKFLKLPIFYSV